MALNELKIQYNFNSSLLGFIPAMIIEKIIQAKAEIKLPDKYTIRTVVMFADISGFTKLSEYLQKEGKEGPELLAFAINRYMELLVKAIGKSGGDIFKYAGDALIVLWPPTKTNSDEELTHLLRQVLQNALDIQAKLDNLAIIEDQKLSVKIGFGVGDVSIIQVGGERGRAEYLAIGEPLTQAFESEHHAESGGVIIVSREVHDKIKEFFVSECISHEGEQSKLGPFYRIMSTRLQNSSVQMKADALMIRTKIKNEQIERKQKTLKSYVAAAVIPFMQLDEEKWSAELRSTTILFISLGIDLYQVMGEGGLDRLQQVITLVQKCVYKYQGSLNKFLMDDKGSTLIVVFGLPPMSHQDDPARGVFTAIEMVRELNKIDCSCSIGITCGTVFTGVVGTSGSRREYSVLGDSVNLSARFMQAAIMDPHNKIFLDEQTKLQSEKKISFKLFDSRPVKGKQGLQNFYVPILPESKLQYNSLANFRCHINNSTTKVIGRQSQIKYIYDNILRFLQRKNGRTRVQFISGEYGIGKTMLARQVMSQVLKYLEREGITYKYGERVQVLVSNLNPEQEVQKYNGVRSVMQMILESYMIRQNYNNKIEAINEVFNKMEGEFVSNTVRDQIYQILDVNNNGKDEVFDYDKNPFVRGTINQFFVQLMNSYLEYNQEDEDDLELQQNISQQDIPAPLIICLEDMQLYDKESWKLIKKMLKRCKRRLYILGLVRDEHYYVNPFYNGIIPFEQYLQKIEEEDKENIMYSKLKLKGLEIDDIEILIKHFKKCFSIQGDLLRLFVHKTKGNPMDVISLLWSLTNGNFLGFSKGELKPKENLKKLMRLNEFITIGVPISRIKINNPVLDKLLVLLPDKQRDVNHKCEKYLLLKVASVIGSTFDSDTLSKVHPFKELITQEKLFRHLQDLVREDILEVLDEGEYCNNITYRFTQPFFREIIYQRITYQHKRMLHRYLVEYLERSMSSGDDEYDQQRLAFHWQMTEDNKNIDRESLSLKAHRSIILRQASNIISQTAPHSRNAILKQGWLVKKDYIGNSWDRRYVVLTIRELRYYIDEKQFLEEQDEPLTSIPLHCIYQVLLKVSQSIFIVSVAQYYSRNEEKGVREFYFQVESIEALEEWKTYIELARTNLVYMDFVSTYGRVKFPLSDFNELKSKKSKRMNPLYVQANQERNDEKALDQAKKIIGGFAPNLRMKNSTIGERMSFSRSMLTDSAMTYSSGSSQQQYNSSAHNIIELTKKRMECFLNVGYNLFCSHLIEAAKYDIKLERNIGKAPEFAFKFPKYYAVYEQLYKYEMDDISISNSVSARTSIVANDSRSNNNNTIDFDPNFFGFSKKITINDIDFNKMSTSSGGSGDSQDIHTHNLTTLKYITNKDKVVYEDYHESDNNQDDS